MERLTGSIWSGPMTTKALRDLFGAVPISETPYKDYFLNFNKYWNNSDRGQANRDDVQGAAAILAYIKDQYQQYQSGDSNMTLPQPSILRSYLDADAEKEFLTDLIDTFDMECEFIFRNLADSPPEFSVRDMTPTKLPPLTEIEDNTLYFPGLLEYPEIDILIRDGASRRYFGISAANEAEYTLGPKFMRSLQKGNIKPADYTHIFVSDTCCKNYWPPEGLSAT
ncbi:MAG: hypothetical protein Q9226_000826 [Calogaya cf. arnoldii]